MILFGSCLLIVMILFINPLSAADQVQCGLCRVLRPPLALVTPEAIKAAIRSGARINKCSRNGRGHLADFIGLCQHEEDLPLVATLLEAGADLEDVSHHLEITPLMMAAFNETPLAVKLISILVNAGAAVDTKHGKYGTTALSQAAAYNSPGGNTKEVIGALIRLGADVNSRSLDGRTPLMYACGKQHDPGVISILLQSGARPELRCDLDKTALDYAEENEFLQESDVIAQLKRALQSSDLE